MSTEQAVAAASAAERFELGHEQLGHVADRSLLVLAHHLDSSDTPVHVIRAFLAVNTIVEHQQSTIMSLFRAVQDGATTPGVPPSPRCIGDHTVIHHDDWRSCDLCNPTDSLGDADA